MCTILNLGPNQEKPNFSPNTETPMNNYNPFIGKRNQKVKMPITKVSLPVEIHKSWHLPESRNFSFLRQCFFFLIHWNTIMQAAKQTQKISSHILLFQCQKIIQVQKRKPFYFPKDNPPLKQRVQVIMTSGQKNFPPPPPVALLTISRLLMNGQIFEFSIKFKSKIVCHGIFISFE